MATKKKRTALLKNPRNEAEQMAFRVRHYLALFEQQFGDCFDPGDAFNFEACKMSLDKLDEIIRLDLRADSDERRRARRAAMSNG